MVNAVRTGIPTVTIVSRPAEIVVEVICPHHAAGAAAPKFCQHPGHHVDTILQVALLAALGGAQDCSCLRALVQTRRSC